MRIRQFPNLDQFQGIAQNCNVIPVCAEILADMETPVSLIQKIYRGNGPAFLFESVEGGERWGRYSFLGTSARCDIRVMREVVEIRENGSTNRIPHHGDPLSELRGVLNQWNPAQMAELPRFWGGMVGYFSYEMVSFFENIPNTLAEDHPLGHFIIPDELLVFDNIRHTVMVLALAFLDKGMDAASAFQATDNRLQKLLTLLESGAAAKPPRLPATTSPLAPVLPPETYCANVKKVKQYIRDGDIIQAVISQPFVCQPAPDLGTLYRAQRFINPSPYLFFMHLGRTALVGSSPETMVRLENGVATVRPIAGTRPRGANEQEDRKLADDLLQDEKERAEHLMLVDLGRNDLGRVAETGTVQVTDLMIVERYSHVMHLVSNIWCDLKPEYDAWDLFKAAFPAGTLSGAPKVRAMEIIAEMETEPRGPYGGAVGYIAFNGNMDMAITIRTACVSDDQLVVRAGAGIVADSDPQTEHSETVQKAMAIQKAVALATAQSNQNERNAKNDRND